MKVGELRSLLKTKKKDELQKMIVEMYKKIPKHIKEEKDIDSLLTDLESAKKKNQNGQQVAFEDVTFRVDYLIEQANKSNYVRPNRIVPKKERSNWRFTVKRLIKQIQSYTSHPVHADESLVYLERIYHLLCEASGYYLFVSDDPFSALNIKQEDLLEQIIILKKKRQEPDDWIKESTHLIVDNYEGGMIIKMELFHVLFQHLHHATLKEIFVEIAERIVTEKERELKKITGLDRMELEFKINDLIEAIVLIKSELGDGGKVNRYFYEHYKETDAEESLFTLLDLILDRQTPKQWQKEYEAAVKRGVKPRESLQEAYQQIQQTGKIPEYIW